MYFRLQPECEFIESQLQHIPQPSYALCPVPLQAQVEILGSKRLAVTAEFSQPGGRCPDLPPGHLGLGDLGREFCKIPQSTDSLILWAITWAETDYAVEVTASESTTSHLT